MAARSSTSAPIGTGRVLLWLAAVGVGVRLAYLAEHAGSAFFGVPVLDEKYYDAVARALLAGGDVAGLNPGFRPFLYPLFLAACHRLGGDWGYPLALLAQHLLGVATALLAADVAARVFRRASAGALAGGLYLLAGPPLFFEGELLITTLFTFLLTAQLWLLARLDPDRTPGWLAAGGWTGLAAQARPNALLIAAAYPAAALLLGRDGRGRRLRGAAVAVAGTLLVLVLFALLARPWIGRFQLLPSSGGINLYLGNRAGADGMVPRQERWVTYGEEYRDSVQVYAAEVYRRETGDPDPDPAAVSRYWTRRTVAEIRSDPGRWLRLMGRKLLFFIGDREIPNNKSYAFIRAEESALLRLLPVRWWLLFALAPLGAVAAWRSGERRPLFWLVALLALHAAGVLLFFVNSRYRLPVWPAMAVLAAGGLLALLRAARQRRWRRLATGTAVAAALALLSLADTTGVEPPGPARDLFFRSLAHLQKGNLTAAEADARRSLEIEPGDPAVHFQLGNVALAAGDDALAFASYRRAAELAPGEPRIYNNMGILHERRGRPADAYRGYLHAIELAPGYAPALVNAALLELRAGLADRAAEKLRKAEKAGADPVAVTCARAFLAQARDREEEAERLLAEARRRDPEQVERLLRAHRRKLPPEALGVAQGAAAER